jgi:hypothetical protein
VFIGLDDIGRWYISPGKPTAARANGLAIAPVRLSTKRMTSSAPPLRTISQPMSP